jgi:hypothetical protein
MITEHTNLNNKESGAGLIAMAFLILVLGFMGTSALYLYDNYELIDDDQTSVDHSKKIQKAILAFAAREGRFPCPAPINASIDSSTYGKEVSTNCLGGALGTGTFRTVGRGGETVRVGTVPTRSLNIPDEYMVDGYGKRFIFAVTERMATPGTNIDSEQGVISVTNDDGHHMTALDGHAIFALVNFGTDDRGAYDVDGNLLAACQASTDAGNNCRFQTQANAPATFVTTLSKSYGSESHNFEHNFAFYSNQPPFRWVTGDWGVCDGVCFTGSQNRVVQCQNVASGEIVNVSDANLNNAAANPCIHSPKPVTSQVCSLGPCLWRQNVPWGACGPAGNLRIPDRRNCR